MPKDLDEIEEMEVDSSTASDLDVATETASAVETAPAESSNATDVTEADTLSVVRDVVEQREEVEAESAPSAEGEVGEIPADDQSEEDNDNYSDVPFGKHPRFQHLLRRVKDSEQDATRYRNVQTFIDSYGLSAQEVADGLLSMGLAKTDPQEAWKRLQPFVKDLLVAAGEVLPDDLAQRVQKKELTRDAAMEMSRLRASEKARTVRDQFYQQRGESQRQVDQGNLLRTTATDWLNDRRLKDPNFAAKEARLGEKIAFLHVREGKPTDAAGVKAQLKRAYDAVNSEALPTAAAPGSTRTQPAKKAIRPVTGGTVANVRSAPKNTMDVIQNVVAARQSA